MCLPPDEGTGADGPINLELIVDPPKFFQSAHHRRPAIAPATGPLWAHFHQSDNKPNGVHFKATHWRCIDARRPKDEPIDVDASLDVMLIKNARWFADGASYVVAQVQSFNSL